MRARAATRRLRCRTNPLWSLSSLSAVCGRLERGLRLLHENERAVIGCRGLHDGVAGGCHSLNDVPARAASKWTRDYRRRHGSSRSLRPRAECSHFQQREKPSDEEKAPVFGTQGNELKPAESLRQGCLLRMLRRGRGSKTFCMFANATSKYLATVARKLDIRAQG
jgi:hypothetical protein